MGTVHLIQSALRTVKDFPVPGISFKDITPILADPVLYNKCIDIMASAVVDHNIDYILSPESRGFLFGAPVALKAEVPFIPVRKPGKLPLEVLSVSYEKEYGVDTLCIHKDDLPAGARVAIIDDLVATYGSAEACCKLAEQAGAIPVLELFLISLSGFEPPKRDINIYSLIQIKEDSDV